MEQKIDLPEKPKIATIPDIEESDPSKAAEEITAEPENIVESVEESPIETKTPIPEIEMPVSSASALAKKIKLKKSSNLPSRENLVRDAKVEIKSSNEEDEVQAEQSFDREDVHKLWIQFLDKKRADGGMETELLVLQQPWELQENRITIHLINPIQQDLLMRFHTDLVGFLRRSLNNKKIEVVHEIKEELREQMLYTNTDKYHHLLKLYPQLKDLSDRLGLDPEF